MKEGQQKMRERGGCQLVIRGESGNRHKTLEKLHRCRPNLTAFQPRQEICQRSRVALVVKTCHWLSVFVKLFHIRLMVRTSS